MKKKIVSAVLAVALLTGVGAYAASMISSYNSPVLVADAAGTAVKSNSEAIIDYSHAADGYFMVKWTGESGPRIKVLVNGPTGGDRYQYNLRGDGTYETFPLSDGNGTYTVGVYKNLSGTSYSTVLSTPIEVTLTDEFAPFIRPNQYVNYTPESQVVAKATELCAGCATNLDKVSVVYNFVINTLTYDTNKADTVQSGYLPDVDAVMAAGTGICFDYAALMSAMLRSQGVPVKLVVGYTGQAYHAWINVWSQNDGWVNNVIYFDGTSWKLMDPTFASGAKESENIMKYIGDGANYTAKYVY